MTLDPSAVRLDGRVAVVTGGGAGIGRGIAAGLAAFGARVAIWERDPDTCASAAGEVGGLSCPTDVRDEGQVDAALARTVADLGTPTILVNNAGGVFHSPLLETRPKGWDALIRANLGHVLLCTQRVARAMVEAGMPGSIVTITSIEGTRAAPGYAAYAAAKAGVINLTRTAAIELAPHGIRVNALAPDLTVTEGLRAVAQASIEDGAEPPGEATQEHGRSPRRSRGETSLAVRPRTLEDLTGMIPMGRAGDVDEVAGAAVFLASELSSYVTGQTIHVDGGTAAAGGWYAHPDDGRWVLGPST